jgi:ArsR family transcriptional regulator
MILGSLRDEELTVSQLQERTGIPQATLSQHLAILRTAGVVTARRDGNHVHYAIANTKIIQAFDLITEVLQETLETRKGTVDAAG